MLRLLKSEIKLAQALSEFEAVHADDQGWQRFTYQLRNCQFRSWFEVLDGTVWGQNFGDSTYDLGKTVRLGGT